MTVDRRLRLAFMGTPDFAVPALEAIIRHGFNVACVYSQPPRPKGRGQHVQPSPVHHLAHTHNIPVRTPPSLKKSPEAQAEFAALDLDVAVVAAYGLILPKAVLDAPRFGCLNIHGSLLPRWRGASPIQHAIWKGDAETGITIMQMDEGLDTGDMIVRRAVPIRSQTTTTSLYNELSALGAAMIVEALKRIEESQNFLPSEKQDNALSTYAPMLSKDDGRIKWEQTAVEIDRQIRALNPAPSVWTMGANGKRLKILEAEVVDETFVQPPATLIDRAGHVACGGDTGLRLLKIQPDNAKPMDIAAAVNGGYLTVGEAI